MKTHRLDRRRIDLDTGRVEQKSNYVFVATIRSKM